MLWTDSSSRQFVAENYPWFLDTFDSYRYNIQRADAIRYFVLYHYGGVYIDLDIGCLKPVDPLLVYPVVLPRACHQTHAAAELPKGFEKRAIRPARVAINFFF